MNKIDEIVENLNKNLKILQKRDGYKYGIDTILLFKFVNLSINKKIKLLDIGTGNGILPVLLYQNDFIEEIIGVDIQEENIERAKKALEINSRYFKSTKTSNFEFLNSTKIRTTVLSALEENELIEELENQNNQNSICTNLSKKIEFECVDIKKYNKKNYFDMIISNPPYMQLDGKKINENIHRAISRHEIALNLEDFIKCSKKLLKPIGKLCFIHRTFRLAEILKELDKNNFCVAKIIFIYSSNNKSSIMYIEALKGKKIKLEVENYFMEEGIDYD